MGPFKSLAAELGQAADIAGLSERQVRREVADVHANASQEDDYRKAVVAQ